jgi:nucleotide-binding universal stress UspA family protein
MSLLKKIVVGHDLKAGGETALQSAAVLAQRCDAEIKLVHVIEPHQLYEKLSHPLSTRDVPEKIAKKAGEKLESCLLNPQLRKLRVQFEVCTGKPFVELVVARRAWQADLVVIGGPADNKQHSLGGTGEHVVRKALVPVLVAKRLLSNNPKTLMVPTDFSAGASKAAKEAVTLAASFDARVIFLHVIDWYPFFATAYNDEMFDPIPQLSAEDLEPEWNSFLSGLSLKNIAWEKRTDEGITGDTIIKQAEAAKADLIVIGTHGRTGIEHMLMGSVAEKVARRSAYPVLTVSEEAFQFNLP